MTSRARARRSGAARVHPRGSVEVPGAPVAVLAAFVTLWFALAGGGGCNAVMPPPEPAAPSILTFEVVQDLGPNQVPTLTVGNDGNVYGTASATVFRIDHAGVFSTYYTSTAGPVARLVVGPDGFLYGFTGQVDYFNPYYDHPGVFFRLDYQGNYAVLSSLPKPIATDLVVGSDGAFYAGTAYASCCEGSAWNDTGMIKITSAGAYTILGGHNGRTFSPVPQVVGSNGAIYGTRSEQGIPTESNVFRLDTAGNFTTIHQMTDAEGFLENFILGSDGFLYATSQQGTGHVIGLDNTGAVTFLHNFAPIEGIHPVGSLTIGGDGAIYGVTPAGGTGAGTVYRVDTAGTLSVQHTFNWPAGGGFPQHGLLLAKDGALYGVTSSGSPGATAFRVDTSGTVSYPVFPSYLTPSSPLVQGSDGDLYGTAFYYDQATSSYGKVVFRLFEPACADGIDNDGDGLIDLADPHCTSPNDTSEQHTPPPPPGCGIGPELVLLLAPLWCLRRRRES